MRSQNFVTLQLRRISIQHLSLKRVAPSKKQIKHFMRRKTIEEPTCHALVFFRGVYFIFHSNLRVFFAFDKEILNVLTASYVWETFFPESNPTRI